MTPLDMTDHMDIMRPNVKEMRQALSKEAVDKDIYIRKLRMSERMDWVDRDKPSARQQLKLKKKFHVSYQCLLCSSPFIISPRFSAYQWTDNPSPAELFKKKKVYDAAYQKYMAGLGPKPPPLVLRPSLD